MIQHECDNDYNSDAEQVKDNKKTLIDELDEALALFLSDDPMS